MDGVDVDPVGIVVELVPVAELAPQAERVRSRKPPWYSYDAVTTASASRRARSPRPAAAASASGVESSRSIPASPSGESASAPGAVRAADGAAGPRQVADERRAGTALDAAREVRQVAGEPEQLELERERERIERRRGVAGGGLVEHVEEARRAPSNARSFASCSANRRSIASAPISPTPSR